MGHILCTWGHHDGHIRGGLLLCDSATSRWRRSRRAPRPPPAPPFDDPPAAAPAAPAPAPPPPAVAAAPPPPAPPKDFADVSALQEIHFDFDKANIRPDAARTLEANAAWL